MPVATKFLYLKRVRFKWGNKKNPISPPLDDLLKAVASGSKNWKDRHHPPPPSKKGHALKAGTRCMYVNGISERPVAADGSGGGVYFTVGSYVFGKGEHQIPVDFASNAKEPVVDSGPIVGKDGKTRYILHEFRCVALGETLIVQNEQGGGGSSALANLLAALFQRYWTSTSLPTVELVDVFSNELKKLLESSGGAERMRIRIIGGTPAKDDNRRFAVPLFNARKLVKGTGQFTAEWAAEDEQDLNVDQVMDAFNEATKSDLESIQIKPRIGGWINDLGKFRARDEVPITIDKHGIEHVSEIKPALYSYLDRVRILDADNWRLVDDKGMFTTAAMTSVMGPKKR